MGYAPGLLVDMWNAQVLAKICSKIGDPLWTDALNGNKESISFAQVLVEVDLARELVTEVPIKFPYGKLREQYVIYENTPKFCTSCQVLGHSTGFCKRKEQPQAEHHKK